MKIILEEHINKRNLPKNLREKDIHLFEKEFEKKIKATHIIKTKNAFVFKDLIVSITLNLNKFTEYTHVVTKFNFLNRLKRILLIRNGIHTIKKAAWVTDEWGLNYFHFITETLPRILILQKVEDKTSILLPSFYKEHSFINESIRELGCSVFFYDVNKPIYIKNLTIISHTAQSGNYNKLLINNLRSKLLLNKKINRQKKIYISREKAHSRKIMNEKEVIRLLESFDFEIHCFENYSFLDQIDLIAQSKILVSIHGAGLTNMLFLGESNKVLEFRVKNDNHNNCYFSLASDLNIDYYYQLCKGDNTYTQIANIQVDLEELKTNLIDMEKNNS